MNSVSGDEKKREIKALEGGRKRREGRRE